MLSTPKYAGEPSVEALASGLATLGRYGDDYMVHAAHGETVIPKEVFDNNPQLKQDLFRQMMMMGIEDPNRYVVGNSLNSINPVTGQPEFFFKKVFRAVKKVFKKALPVIAPIVGNIIAPGIGGIIASGLSAKLQGGSWGDALKAAGMAWAGQGLMGGISGAMSNAPGATFFGGLQQGLTTPFTAASNLFSSGPLNPLQQGIFGSSRSLAGAGLFGKLLTPRYNPNATAIVDPSGLSAAATPSTPSAPSAPTLNAQPPISPVKSIGADLIESAFPGAPAATSAIDQSDTLQLFKAMDAADAYFPTGAGAEQLDDFVYTQPTANQPIVGSGEYSGYPGQPAAPQEISSMAELGNAPTAGPYTPEAVAGADSPDRDFFQKTIDYFNPSKEAAQAARYRDLAAYQEGLKADYLQAGEAISEADLKTESLKWLKNNPEAGFLRRIAPIAGIAGVGLAAATGAFNFEEDEEEFRNKNFGAASEEMMAYDEWKKIGDKNSPQAQSLYFKWHGQPNRTRSQFEYLTGGRSSRPDWMFLPENFQEYRAMGGEVIGPGTGTSDSIPARLSDGEFVMTADAVRNAGGGDRNLGAARMYDMMRRFEGGTA
jgi:hypothetical protein